jgi:antitoxin component YwqK of YwqJK toxin-antitoxin module
MKLNIYAINYMKKILSIILLLFSSLSYGFFGFFSDPVCIDYEKSQERDGLRYLPNQEKPFSGTLTYNSIPKQNPWDLKVEDFDEDFEAMIKAGEELVKDRIFLGCDFKDSDHFHKEEHYKDGKLYKRTVWWNKDYKSSESHYKDGEKHGIQTTWIDSSYKKSEEHYVSGKKHGKYVTWHDSGQKSVETNFKDDELHGEYTSWHSNGQKSANQYYVDGKRHGKFVSWYESGYKKEETNFKNGEINGRYLSWDENGQKSEEASYINGTKERHPWQKNLESILE